MAFDKHKRAGVQPSAMRRERGEGSLYRRRKRQPDGSYKVLSTWSMKYHVNGRPVRESTGETKRAKAQKALNSRLGEVADGRFRGLGIEKVKVGELLDEVLLDYEVNGKAVRFASNCINNHLRPYFGSMPATGVTTAKSKRYVAFRRSHDQGTRPYRGRLREGKRIPIRPASNATINRELALLKHAYYMAWRATPQKVLRIPHIPMLKERNVRKGFFEHEEYLALRAQLPEDLRPVLTFAYYTGCRRGEILNLLWSQVDLAERIVRLEPGETKNDEARILALTKDLYEVIAMQRSVRDARFPDCPWVFFRTDGRKVGNFYRSWNTACIAADLCNAEGEASKLFHDLRRTGVRNLIRAGVPEAVAMRISGHKTRAVFDRYNVVSEQDLHDAARRLDAYFEDKEQAEFGHTLGTPETPGKEEAGKSGTKLLN